MHIFMAVPHLGPMLRNPEAGMSGLHCEIALEIFERFPGYVRGVVVGHGVSNGPAPHAVVARLREAEASVREQLSLEGLAEHPRIKSWRQANHTLTLPETTAIEFNVDGLPPVAPSNVEHACAELQELVQRFCGGRLRREMLTPSHPRMPLTP